MFHRIIGNDKWPGFWGSDEVCDEEAIAWKMARAFLIRKKARAQYFLFEFHGAHIVLADNFSNVGIHFDQLV